MIKNLNYELYNGVKIPAIAFGTWQIPDGKAAYESVLWALEAGYRHIDTAYAYGNEKSVGKAIKDFGIKREDVFITTKLPAEIKTYDEAVNHINASLTNLDVEYIDLYLIHAPWPWSNIGKNCTEGNIEVWKAIVEAYQAKKFRAIGVSNFQPSDIIPLVEATKVKPMVNQIRYFIGNTQPHITSYCQDNNILIEAYSPLATGNILEDENIGKIAKKYNTSIPKICLQYCIQNNTIPLPKSVHKERIFDNINIDFKLSNEDMDYLNNLKEIGPKKTLRS